MPHVCEFRFVKYYFIGRNPRVKWILKKCYYPGCDKEQRVRADEEGGEK